VYVLEVHNDSRGYVYIDLFKKLGIPRTEKEPPDKLYKGAKRALKLPHRSKYGSLEKYQSMPLESNGMHLFNSPFQQAFCLCVYATAFSWPLALPHLKNPVSAT